MRKRIIYLVLLIVVFTGCGRKETKEESPLMDEASEITEQYIEHFEDALSDAVGYSPELYKDSDFAKSDKKGTLKNPYTMGEQIYFDDLRGRDFSEENYIFSFCVDRVITTNEYEKEGITEKWLYGDLPPQILRVSYRLDGELDSIDSAEGPNFSFISEDMVEGYYMKMMTTNFEYVDTIYLGFDYDFYICDYWTLQKQKYLCIDCNTFEGIRKIYVILE